MDACTWNDCMTTQPAGEPKRRMRTLAERIAAARNRVHREVVDFNAVPPSQWKMHDRLENWARWCRGRDKQAGGTDSPMFRLHKSDAWDARQYGAATVVPVDKDDAVRIAKGIAHLPDKHRRALNWHYLHPKNPTEKARELGLSLPGLAQMVRDARQFLINRGV